MTDWRLAFVGISHGEADLAEYLAALHPDRKLVPLGVETVEAIGRRILELEEIVKQNALTAADLPHQGWSGA